MEKVNNAVIAQKAVSEKVRNVLHSIQDMNQKGKSGCSYLSYQVLQFESSGYFVRALAQEWIEYDEPNATAIAAGNNSNKLFPSFCRYTSNRYNVPVHNKISLFHVLSGCG